MLTDEIMQTSVQTCAPTDSLATAARLMWDHDCGCVVVVDGGKPVAMITDRDICMCAYTHAGGLSEIPVSVAASQTVHTVRANDKLDYVESLMRDKRIRRVPVVDDTGKLVGIVTLNDLFRSAGQLGRRHHALSAEALVRTMSTIGTPAAHT